jgi:flagellar biogenesis protein FliO
VTAIVFESITLQERENVGLGQKFDVQIIQVFKLSIVVGYV